MTNCNHAYKWLASWILLICITACQYTSLLPTGSGEGQTPPPPRTASAMAYDEERQVTVLFGGSNDTGKLGDTWEYDGQHWREIPTQQSPTARSGHTMAYDSQRGVTVLYGGDSETDIVTDTWEYNGENWHQRDFTDPTPDLRFDTSTMVYDAQRQVVVLFGTRILHPMDLSTYYETWLYDGHKWTDATSPMPQNWGIDYPGLVFPNMVYDAKRQVVVLQGNRPWTYEWDGTHWYVAVESDSPQAIPEEAGGPPGIAYDQRRGVTVMFGGRHGDNITWEYDGQQWGAATPTQSPPMRIKPAMAYDAARQVTVLFGGNLEHYQELNDTWEYDGATWTLKLEGNPTLLSEP